MKKHDRLKLAYDFFVEHARSEKAFEAEDVARTTGWTLSSVDTYLRKQWAQLVTKVDGGTGNPNVYVVLPGFEEYPLDVFLRINSQKFMINKDPFKPLISRKTEELVTKSRESALLAVQVFNNPLIHFRFPSFCIHMIIAFTSLFHALFEEAGIDYIYRNKDNPEHRTKAGQPRFWDLSRCVKQWWGDNNDAIRSNIELFIQLRDEAEHRFAPAFDLAVAGECQSLILNFEKMLTDEFSPYYGLGGQISIPLQLTSRPNKERINAMRELQKADYNFLRNFLDVYRSSQSEDILASLDYCFSVYLLPKAANRLSSSDFTMEFIRPEDLDDEQMADLQRRIALIKMKQVPVINLGGLRPSQVVRMVQESTEPRFRLYDHSCAWRFYKVRPRDKRADGCAPRFCHYDEAHNDFVYSMDWVEFLKSELRKEGQYERLREEGQSS